MSTNKNWFHDLFINEAKPALERHGTAGDSAEQYEAGYKAGYEEGLAEPPSQTEVINGFAKLKTDDMSYMFRSCNTLTSLDLSNINASAVTNMQNMFFNCHSLLSIDFTNFNASAVTNMANMFQSCMKLTSLDLSNFNASAVTNMPNMFYNCNRIVSLNLNSFDTSAVTSMDNMFYKCDSLSDLILGDTFVFNTNINFQWSPLSTDSMKSVISHLKNYSGTDKAFAYTVTFSDTCWANLDAEGATAPGGVTWRKYVENLGWNA